MRDSTYSGISPVTGQFLCVTCFIVPNLFVHGLPDFSDDSDEDSLSMVQRTGRYLKQVPKQMDGVTLLSVEESGLGEEMHRPSSNLSWTSSFNALDNHTLIEYFKEIQRWRSTPEMTDFIKALLQSAGAEIPTYFQLRGVALYYSGEVAKQPLTQLWDELASKHWLPGGEKAAFTEAGYWAVAQQRNHTEMAKYIHRLIQSDGGEVLNPDSLNGLTFFYSGEKAMQSLARLRDEVKTKGVEDGWVVYLHGHVAQDNFIAVQSENNTEKMARFIATFIRSAGGKVPNNGTLGFVSKFYSGERAAQGFDTLWNETVKKGWMPDGQHATFTEEGYQAVAMLRNRKEMEVFIRRLIEMDGGQVTNPGGLTGLVQHYSGERGPPQSLARLRAELPTKAETESWLHFAKTLPGSFQET